MKPVRICVSAPKGGVGKTFLSVHLAWLLSEKHIPTALLDFGSTLSATKYLDRQAFNRIRKMQRFAGVERIGQHLVIAAVEDWDKLPNHTKERDALFSNPQAPPSSLAGGNTLADCEVFIYDTDHYISSLAYFADNFDAIFLIIDPADFHSLDNLSDFWTILMNERSLTGSPGHIFILANRTKQTKSALTKVKSWMKTRCTELEIPKEQIKEYQASLEQHFVMDFAIPKFTKAKDSFTHNVPIWTQGNNNKQAFNQFYKFLKQRVIS